MRRLFFIMVIFFFLTLSITIARSQGAHFGPKIKLPELKRDGTVSVEKALMERRTIRDYKDTPISVQEVSQLLLAAQGITEPSRGLRTTPSARAKHFLTVYLLAGNVKGLKSGMYRYVPDFNHILVPVGTAEVKVNLYKTVGQSPVNKAPAVFVITGAHDRATNANFMYIEVGHAAQNIYLQAVPLGLGTVVIGGFDPEEVSVACGLTAQDGLSI